ncbi:hypothetical protein GM541_14590, partial [Streptococcus pneumoniae]|nr:hypothetical protein [Streptococcus pneumoniae]
MTAVGAGGAITGKGSDVLLIDDLYKDLEDAQSPTQSEKIWEWFRAVAYTRLAPKASVIMVMTRWDENDIIGRIK